MSVVDNERPTRPTPAETHEGSADRPPTVIETLSRLVCTMHEDELPDYDREYYKSIDLAYFPEREHLMCEAQQLFLDGYYLECQLTLKKVALVVYQSFDRSALPMVENVIEYLGSMDTTDLDYRIEYAKRYAQVAMKATEMVPVVAEPTQKAA